MTAIIPYTTYDMDFLANLCNKYNLDIYSIVENVKEIHSEFFAMVSINSYIQEALEQTLYKAIRNIQEQIKCLESEPEPLSHFIVNAKSLLQNTLNYIENKGLDTIYTNCVCSGFNCEFLNNSEILTIKSPEEALDWAENNIAKYDINFFNTL